MNSTNQTNKFTRFLRNNAALLLLVFCVVAIGAVVIAVSVTGDNVDTPVGGNPDGTTDTPVVDKPIEDTPKPVIVKEKIYFASPVAYQSVGMQYTDDELLFVFNPTLNQWATHNGVDLIAPESTPVTSMYDGVVVEVGESYGMGHYVKVDHGDNVVATYASLADVEVVAGQNVAKGDKLGVVSTTASFEFSDGAHLHLEVAVNGKQVDPMDYVEGKMYREIERTIME